MDLTDFENPLTKNLSTARFTELEVLLAGNNDEEMKEKRRRVATTSSEQEVTTPASTKKASTSPKRPGGKFRNENRRLKYELELRDQKSQNLMQRRS